MERKGMEQVYMGASLEGSCILMVGEMVWVLVGYI